MEAVKLGHFQSYIIEPVVIHQLCFGNSRSLLPTSQLGQWIFVLIAAQDVVDPVLLHSLANGLLETKLGLLSSKALGHPVAVIIDSIVVSNTDGSCVLVEKDVLLLLLSLMSFLSSGLLLAVSILHLNPFKQTQTLELLPIEVWVVMLLRGPEPFPNVVVVERLHLEVPMVLADLSAWRQLVNNRVDVEGLKVG